MENQKLLKQIRKLVDDNQINLLNNICNHLGISDNKKNELKGLYIDGNNGTVSITDTPNIKKKTNRRQPSQYNEFVKNKIAELRASGDIPPSQALQVAAKAWKDKDNVKLITNEVTQHGGDNSKSLININETSIDLTPTISEPCTPLLNNDTSFHQEDTPNEKIQPKSLTRIRFFGSTYLWDKIDNLVYNDDTNNSLVCIGKMDCDSNNQPSKILFS